MAFIARPTIDASWLHPHRTTLLSQNARPGPIPIMSTRGGLPWSKSRLRPEGRFGYAGYGLVPAQGLQVWTEPNTYISPYKTPTRRVLRGYGAYEETTPQPTVKWSPSAAGVGLGTFGVTLATGLLVQGLIVQRDKAASASSVLVPLAGAGLAGFAVYMLRARAERLCECPKEPRIGITQTGTVAGEMPVQQVTRKEAIRRCPEGMIWNPDQGRCETTNGLI
jgi:hypothetical protein